ncbi:GlcG/HbpS family heme-binding protein [Methylocella silvestris]|uniref:Heme-binding protein n=1 Tax=Methylocella silvestris TaxID=199596 RepID=A0A2J7TJK2_METSI|nr:heme-binding protein [Methylocella silvestris]PNG26950.1 hypothetical protein CR492_05675 [Methylocella silvestris]
MKKMTVVLGLGLLAQLAAAPADARMACNIPDATVKNVQAQLDKVIKLADANGGIFKPNRMWSAIVDRKGQICSVISIGDAWPGSRAIAIAKAGTANDFSNDGLALSTANLYAPTQPGGSLYGLNNSNPFDPAFLAQDSLPQASSSQVASVDSFPELSRNGKVPGGIITFGGGVALYDANKKVLGGLGVSGDSSCADHAIAYRMRKAAKLDNIPGGVGPGGTDNIDYAALGVAPTGFQQPHCFPSDITP